MKWDYAFIFTLGIISGHMEPWWVGDISNSELVATIIVALILMPISAFVFMERK
jgi:hypothetical protein